MAHPPPRPDGGSPATVNVVEEVGRDGSPAIPPREGYGSRRVRLLAVEGGLTRPGCWRACQRGIGPPGPVEMEERLARRCGGRRYCESSGAASRGPPSTDLCQPVSCNESQKTCTYSKQLCCCLVNALCRSRGTGPATLAPRAIGR
jgi:hypothetical protein